MVGNDFVEESGMGRRARVWVGLGVYVLGAAIAVGEPPQEGSPLAAGAVVSRFTPLTGSAQAEPARESIPFLKQVEAEPTAFSFSRFALLESNILPINLATALQLASARPIDVMVAAKQIELATIQYERTRLAWIPNISFGGDYLRHDGSIQNFQGTVLKSNRGSLMGGLGANAVFALTDAIFAPLAASRDLEARQANAQAVTNDVTLSVAESYFSLVQARGDYSVAEGLVREGELLVRRTEDLAEGLAPPVEASRTRVELARRKQAAITAKERWRIASAELTRLLRLDPTLLLDPLEPANLVVPVVDGSAPLDDLIQIALLNRPELAANQALVQATLQRLKQEKLRPLIPSVLLRSTSTNPSNSLGFGVFGGGSNNRLADFSTRFDYDVQILWEMQNLGFGNRNRVRERNAEHELAVLEAFRTQDRIASEVSNAYSQFMSARDRLRIAEPAVKEATETFQKNVETLSQTRRVGNALILIVRPQEVVASLQALATANADYLAVVSDYNKAQFRLYRAVGHSASIISERVQDSSVPATNRLIPRRVE